MFRQRATWVPYFDDGQYSSSDSVVAWHSPHPSPPSPSHLVLGSSCVQPDARRGSPSEPTGAMPVVVVPTLPNPPAPQEDSLMSWRELCANPLLSRCNLIIFFNKVRRSRVFPSPPPELTFPTERRSTSDAGRWRSRKTLRPKLRRRS